MIEYTTTDELRAALCELARRPDERWIHIGQGSNLLFTADYDGTVLHSRLLGCRVVEETADDVVVRAASGEDWDGFVRWCVEQGFYGLENLALIPGEVGASAVQNVGAYGVEAGDLIIRVHTIDALTGEERTFSRGECGYAYRQSVFKTTLRGRYVVTHVDYRLSRRFVPNLRYAALLREVESRGLTAETLTARQLCEVVSEVRRSKLPDPHVTGSAGSFFMNPVVDADVFSRLSATCPDVPHFDLPDGRVKVPAGWLIERCGWKGHSLGRAGVYDKQALVLVNLGGATGQDIVRLSEAVRRDVRERFGIEICPEVNFI